MTGLNRDVPFSGPAYRKMAVEGDKVRLSFDHAGGGLVSKRGPVTGVIVAAADRHFVPAEAQIDGETLLVRAPGVAQPVAVRYAWEDNPDARLCNKDGLPASPFRTDDWPLIGSTRPGGNRPAPAGQE